MGIVVSKTP